MRVDAAAASSLLDEAVLPRVLGLDDPAVLAEFYGDFATQLEPAARNLLLATDLDVIVELAHGMRSACLAVGACALDGLLERMESCRTTGDRAALDGARAELPAYTAATLARVREVVRRLKGDDS